MNSRGMILLFAAMLAVVVPGIAVAADMFSDDTGVTAEGTEIVSGLFDSDEGWENIVIDNELIISLCLVAVVALIAIAYYYRS